MEKRVEAGWRPHEKVASTGLLGLQRQLLAAGTSSIQLSDALEQHREARCVPSDGLRCGSGGNSANQGIIKNSPI